LGWKAIPFALEDFDSNCAAIDCQQIPLNPKSQTVSGGIERGGYLSEHVWGGLHLEGDLVGAAPYRSKLRTLIYKEITKVTTSSTAAKGRMAEDQTGMVGERRVWTRGHSLDN
jgi:hypothetical protein